MNQHTFQTTIEKTFQRITAPLSPTKGKRTGKRTGHTMLWQKGARRSLVCGSLALSLGLALGVLLARPAEAHDAHTHADRMEKVAAGCWVIQWNDQCITYTDGCGT